MQKQIDMVRQFHKKFDYPYAANAPIDFREPALRARLIREEAEETASAIEAGNMIATADGLADLAYVLFGTCVNFAIDLEPIFAEVHRTNMLKENGGKDGGGKIQKPPGWQPPDIEKLLRAQGWVPTRAELGQYLHHKGEQYIVTGHVFLANNGVGHDRAMLVQYYRIGNENELYARSVQEFLENVTWPDGTEGPRFKYLHP